VTDDELTHVHEVRARLDSAATLASQALLDEVEMGEALNGLLGLVENARGQLQAIGL
jgi:hypothetical protein